MEHKESETTGKADTTKINSNQVFPTFTEGSSRTEEFFFPVQPPTFLHALMAHPQEAPFFLAGLNVFVHVLFEHAEQASLAVARNA